MAVYKDKNGTWYVSARYTNWKGEADRKLKRGFQTKKEATEWERNFFLENAGNLEMTFEAFYELYKKNMQDRIKLSTWKMKESVIESKILPYFRKKRMCDIKPRDVVTWQNTMLKMRDDDGNPYSPVYLKTIHNQLSAIFNHAVKFYDLPNNPAQKAGNMGKEKSREMLFWTQEEYKAFAEAVMDKPISFYAFEVLYVRNYIHTFKKAFDLVSPYPLIVSTANGYGVNPELNIMTDLRQFDLLWENAQHATSISHKVELLKQAAALYKGSVFENAGGELWIESIATHYRLRYVGIINELLATLDEAGDYTGVQQYAAKAVELTPENPRAHYWLIHAMNHLGTLEFARNQIALAKEKLTGEEYPHNPCGYDNKALGCGLHHKNHKLTGLRERKHRHQLRRDTVRHHASIRRA